MRGDFHNQHVPHHLPSRLMAAVKRIPSLASARQSTTVYSVYSILNSALLKYEGDADKWKLDFLDIKLGRSIQFTQVPARGSLLELLY